MKGVWGAVAAVAIIIVAGVILSSYFSKKADAGKTVQHRAAVACDKCGKAYITMIGDPPAKCFYCGSADVWQAMQCADCQTIFPIVKGRYKDPASNVCPKCGKNNFKEVPPDGLETH